MPCGNVWVNSFDPKVPSGFEYICWDGDDHDDSYRPPTGGTSEGAGSAGGVSGGGGSVSFDPDPSGSGTVIVADGSSSAPPGSTSLRGGWNAGAHSIQSVPADWAGLVSFDVPDVQGARQGGIAVGFAPVANLPTVGRSGYAHLRYGLVFTSSYVRVISAGKVVSELSYAPIRAARSAEGTDTVKALLYGSLAKWIVNGVTLSAGAFQMPGPYALDATLYLAFDAVDNPKFEESWPDDLEDGSLNGLLPAFSMSMTALAAEGLSVQLPAFTARFSQNASSDLQGSLPGFGFSGVEGEGASMVLGPFRLVLAEDAKYSAMLGALGAISLVIGMDEPDESVPYSVLFSELPRFGMSMTFPPTARLEASISPLEMRASSEASYADLRMPLRGFRFRGYGGSMTPLIEVVESIGTRMPVYQSTYIALVLVERIGGGMEAVGYATVTADGMERISVQDSTDYTAALFDAAMEQVGLGERVVVLTHLSNGGALVDEGEAWVVNTRTNASSRYDQYGFNSFAVLGGRHLGVRADGVYRLEGADDAGRAIKSGVSLGQHDFGTLSLKRLGAVYAGVSSTGTLFLKVGDGKSAYTYRARRKDDRMKVQRFDPGRGLESNYFTFELTSEADAFELDSVSFQVLASQRRI